MITEKKNLGKAIKTIVLTICILTTLGGVGIWFFADYITFFLGAKWIDAIPVIKVLAFWESSAVLVFLSIRFLWLLVNKNM